MGIDLWALLGTGIIVLIGLGLRNLRRRSQTRQQLRLDERYAAGLAAGKSESSRLAYVQGHEDGLVEGRAQAGRVDLIKYNKAYDEGYEQGQSDLLSALTNQAHGDRPTMSA